MRYIIDRIESGIAICNCMETGEDIEIPASELPPRIKEGLPRVKEGDVITKTEGGYKYDAELTKKRRADLTDRMNRLFSK